MSDLFYKERLKKLQKQIQEEKLDAFFIEDSLHLFYFTGLRLSAGKLIVTTTQQLLLVDSRYKQLAESLSFIPSGLETCSAALDFCKSQGVKKIGCDGSSISYERFVCLKKTFGKEIEIISEPHLLKQIRLIKGKEEIALLKKSAHLLWKGFEFLKTRLEENKTEKELAKQFEIFCLEQGADRLAFEPIIAFGSHSAMPHHRASLTPLKAADLVLIDIGVVVQGYHSDMTRVLFYKQEDPYLKSLYEIVKRAQKEALKLCKPGQKFAELDLAARKVFQEEKVEELFLHSLGHGIGLEIHEYPRIKYDQADKDLLLQEGMVFTVEPGLYVPGKGGVRYEDTIVVTETGYENFYP